MNCGLLEGDKRYAVTIQYLLFSDGNMLFFHHLIIFTNFQGVRVEDSATFVPSDGPIRSPQE